MPRGVVRGAPATPGLQAPRPTRQPGRCDAIRGVGVNHGRRGSLGDRPRGARLQCSFRRQKGGRGSCRAQDRALTASGSAGASPPGDFIPDALKAAAPAAGRSFPRFAAAWAAAGKRPGRAAATGRCSAAATREARRVNSRSKIASRISKFSRKLRGSRFTEPNSEWRAVDGDALGVQQAVAERGDAHAGFEQLALEGAAGEADQLRVDLGGDHEDHLHAAARGGHQRRG